MSHAAKEFESLNIAVLTVSDTRDESNDTSGKFLVDSALEAGHKISEKRIEKDDIFQIRYQVSKWIASEDTQVVLITGGTGFTSRDSTPEAVSVLFEKEVEGFGELFRKISFDEIGTSTIQSRAVAGLANGTLIACMPGSTGACRTAWSGILKEQLNATHKPCNFVMHLKQATADLCESRS
ncbi:molybdenum cofactor biosynthesis protein B [Reinekea marinisedimentorum]|uniref:Molybdenum cofactor biosynthesis protein B n=1 Tax=Reinekea marinisedimentorum TaxID=230495 RepID=A0A4R3I3M5_9GAMM|nr:molybdenum cofactor biosynthesis protein B [Reinekea marinisedimentorum]TCS40174.1 molybdenum cofactor biosynthesis protein B [Reinekea marinisedimentorum]